MFYIVSSSEICLLDKINIYYLYPFLYIPEIILQ